MLFVSWLLGSDENIRSGYDAEPWSIQRIYNNRSRDYVGSVLVGNGSPRPCCVDAVSPGYWNDDFQA